ncbi:MAG TPA: GNAT family N-acetyltransferase [Gaiellales bacterium]|nr:GNAT family N-acetyltransferase [Gaiellales bacterium]
MTAGVGPAEARVHDVILRDGRTLRLRPPGAADAEAVRRFLTALSPATLHLRFHAIPRIDDTLVAKTLDPDWESRGALIAVTLGDDGAERVVGLGSYDRLRDPRAAEVAFVVADDRHSDGIATRLLEELAEEAAALGVERFVAEVLPENGQMMRVFQDSGFAVSTTTGAGELHIEFPIRSDERYTDAVDVRHHTGVTRSLRPVLVPATVAVVGASARDGSIGGALFQNIVDGGFDGRAYPVNRSGDSVAGHAAYPSVAAIQQPIDLAVIAVPAGAVLAAAREALEAGARALCVISAGFAETGPAGADAEDHLLALVRAHGARLVGPNCLGIVSAEAHLNATFARTGMPPGNIALSSQSGAVGLAVIDEAAARGLGFSAFVSIGNKADVSSNDLLEYWEDDPAAAVIALYLESFGNPRRFARIARRVARRKPILALKAGATPIGERAALSHTAALAGSNAAAEALFHQAGVLRAHTLEEFEDALQLLATQPLPRRRRLAILSNAGGLAILCGDACAEAGFELAALSDQTRAHLSALVPAEATVLNPVDLLGSATAETFAAAAPLVLADADVDALIVLAAPTAVVSTEAAAQAISAVWERASRDKPVLMVTPGGEPAHGPVPCYRYPEAAVRALRKATDRATWLRRPHGRFRQIPSDRAEAHAVIDAALAAPDQPWLPADAARRLLSAYGIPHVAQRVVTNTADAVDAARRLGYPLAVKGGSPGAHKTDVGAVVLGVADEAALTAALDQVGPAAVLQPMVEGGVELLAGAVQDPVFGPVVAFGPGGIWTEVIGGATVAAAPMTDVDAEELVTSGKAGALISGFRGYPPADVPALVDLVLRVAALAEDFPEVAELDLNPVMALGNDCVAVDGRIRIARAPARRRLKTW